MPSEPNNPAARLLAFIQKARGIPGNISTRDGWARLFDLNNNDLPGILLGITDLIQLTNETRQAIQALDGLDHALYLRPVDKVLTIFTIMRFDVEWAQIIGQFDETTLYGLSICNDLLSKYSQEKPIAEETLKSMLDDIEALHEDVLNSDLPEELKSFLLEQLEKLRSALLHYRIFGSKRLRSALESITGAIFLKGYEIVPFWETPIMKRVMGLLSQIAIMVTLAQGFQALANGIQGLLGSGKP